MSARGDVQAGLLGLIAGVMLPLFGIWARYLRSENNSLAYLEKPGVLIQHYEIDGNSLEQLRDSINERGPLDGIMHRRDAYTRWKISWDWPFTPGGKPDFDKVRASCDVSVTLPRLGKSAQLEPDKLGKWNGYLKAVRKHEAEHVKGVLENYNSIPAKIRSAWLAQPELTAHEANGIAREVVVGIRRFDADFDRYTRHGRLQGVVLP